MSGTTERVIVPVKGGVEDWKEQLKVLLQTLKEQKGYLRTRWGPHSEDLQKLELLIGESVLLSVSLVMVASS
jgi:hypothetical protein